MTRSKRIFDILLAVIGLILLIIPAVLVTVGLLVSQGRPILYASERMKSIDEKFLLWKFRTMQISGCDSGVTGGDKTFRITRAGKLLRRTRLDEVPQLWNILSGDMSFVGPRPQLPIYVERFPSLYAGVLQSRPGLTGLATLFFYKREETLLSFCKNPVETDAVYTTRCIPRKARLDMIYVRKKSLLLDIRVMALTISYVFKKQRSA